MEILILVLVGAVLGLLVDTFTPGRIPFGYLLGILLGIAGAVIGVNVVAPPLDLVVGGVDIADAALGAVVLTLVVDLIIGLATRRPRR
ncbi:MAG: GlsB/YeaQ/YmgE family stress response membrane protein [Chloroflexota bacterium]